MVYETPQWANYALLGAIIGFLLGILIFFRDTPTQTPPPDAAARPVGDAKSDARGGWRVIDGGRQRTGT